MKDAPCQYTTVGGQLDHQEDSGHIESVREHRNVVKGAEYDWIGCVHNGNECGVKTDALCLDMPPGGPKGDQTKLGDDKVDQDHPKVVEGAKCDGIYPRSIGAECDIKCSTQEVIET